jgi:hypothetical protein
MSSVKEFERLTTETRQCGHNLYFVTKAQKWCLRFPNVYRNGQSVAFLNKNLNTCFKQAVEFIKENRIKDDKNHYRPYRLICVGDLVDKYGDETFAFEKNEVQG